VNVAFEPQKNKANKRQNDTFVPPRSEMLRSVDAVITWIMGNGEGFTVPKLDFV